MLLLRFAEVRNDDYSDGHDCDGGDNDDDINDYDAGGHNAMMGGSTKMLLMNFAEVADGNISVLKVNFLWQDYDKDEKK